MIEHNLSECQEPEQRRNLLRGLMVLLDQIDEIFTNEESFLESKLNSKTATKMLEQGSPPIAAVPHLANGHS